MSAVIKTIQSLPLSNGNYKNAGSSSQMQNDLIAGHELLALFGEQPEIIVNSRPHRTQRDPQKVRKRKRIMDPFQSDESSEGVLPIENMFTSASTHSLASAVRVGNSYMYRQNRNNEDNNDDFNESYPTTGMAEETTVAYEEEPEPTTEEFPFDKIISIRVSSDKRASRNGNDMMIMSFRNTKEPVHSRKSSNTQNNEEDSENSESTNSQVVTSYDSRLEPHEQQNFRTQRQQQHDLLFQSGSATVTSSGPSGPFKAIICHDCDMKNEDDDSSAPHSVSFSAIKNWNLGQQNHENMGDQADTGSDHEETHDDDEVEDVEMEPIKAEVDIQKSILPKLAKVEQEQEMKTNDSSKEPEPYVHKLIPAKFYSLPSLNYGTPSRVYSSPSKVYSVPSKVYYDMPGKMELPVVAPITPTDPVESIDHDEADVEEPSWKYLPSMGSKDKISTTTTSTPKPRRPIFTDLIKVPYDALNYPQDEYPRSKPKVPVQINHQQNFDDHNVTSNYQHFQQFIQKNLNPPSPMQMHKFQTTQAPEQNYEIEEAVSVMSNGRVHGVQTSTSITPKSTTIPTIDISTITSTSVDLSNGSAPPKDAKFGYVVEGRNYRKYRVEEKTPDGFIVGEYGVVSNNDGSLRGVRYTADSNINPRLIYDALLKFLSL